MNISDYHVNIHFKGQIFFEYNIQKQMYDILTRDHSQFFHNYQVTEVQLSRVPETEDRVSGMERRPSSSQKLSSCTSCLLVNPLHKHFKTHF